MEARIADFNAAATRMAGAPTGSSESALTERITRLNAMAAAAKRMQDGLVELERASAAARAERRAEWDAAEDAAAAASRLRLGSGLLGGGAAADMAFAFG